MFATNVWFHSHHLNENIVENAKRYGLIYKDMKNNKTEHTLKYTHRHTHARLFTAVTKVYHVRYI